MSLCPTLCPAALSLPIPCLSGCGGDTCRCETKQLAPCSLPLPRQGQLTEMCRHLRWQGHCSAVMDPSLHLLMAACT